MAMTARREGVVAARGDSSRTTRMAGLDGLRALAVGGVLLYHAGVAWAPGGFLGVDLFFVISGFLITSLLISERQRSGAISIGRFYLRRARRLLPALFTMVAATSLFMALFARGDIEDADEDLQHVPTATADADCICLAVTDAPLRFRSWLVRLVQPVLGI